MNEEDLLIINGITFYYDGITMNDNLLKRLEDFSLMAEDESYSVYVDDGNLVIY